MFMEKTREEIIFELLLSLNNGNCGCINSRVQYAENQYKMLVEAGIVKEQ